MVSTAWALARLLSLTIKKRFTAAPMKRKKKFELKRSKALYILAISMVYSGLIYYIGKNRKNLSVGRMPGLEPLST
jgi:hypothetical protein